MLIVRRNHNSKVNICIPHVARDTLLRQRPACKVASVSGKEEESNDMAEGTHKGPEHDRWMGNLDSEVFQTLQ